MLKLSSIATALALAAVLSPAAYAATAFKNFVIINNGNAPLNISEPAISGNVTEYSFWDASCAAPVPVGGNCSLWAFFTPVAGGERPPASLDFKSDGADGPNHSLALTGSGVVLPPANCSSLLASAPGTPSGYYTIQPSRTVGGAQYSAYCDMTTEGGGWTRINASLVATSTRTFGANDVVSGNSVGSTACDTVKSNWTVTNPVIAYNNIRIQFTRTTTIMQCSALAASTDAFLMGQTGSYWSGSAWVDNTTCTWSDNIWAGSNTYTGTLPKTWRLKSNKSFDGTIRLTTRCGVAEDTGAFTATMWLR